jgi:hypothetical protein
LGLAWEVKTYVAYYASIVAIIPKNARGLRVRSEKH